MAAAAVLAGGASRRMGRDKATLPVGGVELAALALAAAGAFGLSYAQRSLSTPARLMRRRVSRVEGSLTMEDGTVRGLDERTMLQPLERALQALSWSLVALALALAWARLG